MSEKIPAPYDEFKRWFDVGAKSIGQKNKLKLVQVHDNTYPEVEILGTNYSVTYLEHLKGCQGPLGPAYPWRVLLNKSFIKPNPSNPNDIKMIDEDGNEFYALGRSATITSRFACESKSSAALVIRLIGFMAEDLARKAIIEDMEKNNGT